MAPLDRRGQVAMTTTTTALLSSQLSTRRKGKLRLYVCSGIVLLYILAAFCGNLITHYSQNSINIISTLVPTVDT